jgi:uncharacterized protein
MELFLTKQIDLQVVENTDGEIVAYLTTFENPDKVGDVIKAGALDEFISKFDPETQKLPMLYNHETSKIIGEWKQLEIDEVGLKGTGIIYTETSLGADVMALLKRGAVAAVSIGFSSSKYEKLVTGGVAFKTISLVETSVVLNPANPNAKVISVKSEDGFIETKLLKSVLREAGLNRTEIEALFNEGWKGLKNLRDIERSDEEVISTILETLKSFQL